MNLQMIYPRKITNVVLENDKLFFNGFEINILEKIDERTYKISFCGMDYGFVHDEKYCAYDFWQSNLLDYHTNAWFIKIPKHDSLFCDISKNACTTIISEIYNNYYLKSGEKAISTDEFAWKNLSFLNCFMDKMKYETDKYFSKKKKFSTIFFIYDDPIKRFVRVLNYKYNNTNENRVLSSLAEPYDDVLQDYISKFILLTRLNLLNVSAWDQHIVPISLWTKNIISEITDIVLIEDIQKFMIEKFDITPKRYNVSNKKTITQNILTQKHLSDIKTIYKEDFEIPIKYADKIYK